MEKKFYSKEPVKTNNQRKNIVSKKIKEKENSVTTYYNDHSPIGTTADDGIKQHDNTPISIYILGTTGLLGNYLKDFFCMFTCHQVFLIDRNTLDVNSDTKESNLKFVFNRHSQGNLVYVINCIALTNKIKAHDDEFMAINSKFPKTLHKYCKKHGLIMIQPSTDCVFSGLNGRSYSDNDKSNVKDPYGVSKAGGECGMVVRTSIIGENPTKHQSLLEVVKLNKGGSMEGYVNQYWNGVTCLEMAKFLNEVISKRLEWTGVKHLSSGIINKCELIKMMSDVYDLNINIQTKKLDATVNKTLLSSSSNLVNFCRYYINNQLKELKKWHGAKNQYMYKRVLIFGGSGSLGTTLINEWKDKVEKFIIYSRGELKQWKLKQKFPSVNFEMILGDVVDYQSVQKCILDVDPSLIIYASAMKHVERCEDDILHCVNTNILGFNNVVDIIKHCRTMKQLSSLKKVLLISTDKACSPVNVYGMSKSISEHNVQRQVVNSSSKSHGVKWCAVRYGNVLNSNGSVIPVLKHQVQQGKTLTLTHKDMTRFFMTLEESVKLIDDAVNYGNDGEIWIPMLKSFKIEDLMKLFCEKYKCSYEVSGMRSGEKIHEELLSNNEYKRIHYYGNRIIIKPYEQIVRSKLTFSRYSSNNFAVEYDELKTILSDFI